MQEESSAEEQLVQEEPEISAFQDTVLENIADQQVNPKALEEKEIAEAKAVLEKHGMFVTPANQD